MGSARLAAYHESKGCPTASLVTLDLIEPLIVLQLVIIPFPNFACLEKKGGMQRGLRMKYHSERSEESAFGGGFAAWVLCRSSYFPVPKSFVH
jgi:hypothetical protein